MRTAAIRIDSHTGAASLVAQNHPEPDRAVKTVCFVFFLLDSDEMPSKNNEVVIML